MCFGCSKEPSHWDGSFEYPQHMFWLRNKKNNFQLHTLIWRPDAKTAHLNRTFGVIRCYFNPSSIKKTFKWVLLPTVYIKMRCTESWYLWYLSKLYNVHWAKTIFRDSNIIYFKIPTRDPLKNIKDHWSFIVLDWMNISISIEWVNLYWMWLIRQSNEQCWSTTYK